MPLSTEALSTPITLFCAVLISPILEEIFFRKLLIDRLKKYGERLAVVLSSVLFALSHATSQQLFYSFFFGIILSTLYVKTGRVRYTILLHIIVNFLGSAVSMYIASTLINAIYYVDPNRMLQAIISNKESLLALLILALLLAMALIGAVTFAYYVKTVRLKNDSIEYRKTITATTLAYVILSMILILFRSGA